MKKSFKKSEEIIKSKNLKSEKVKNQKIKKI